MNSNQILVILAFFALILISKPIIYMIKHKNDSLENGALFNNTSFTFEMTNY